MDGLRLPKQMGKVKPVFYGETLFWVALQISVNPSSSILKYVSEMAHRWLKLNYTAKQSLYYMNVNS